MESKIQSLPPLKRFRLLQQQPDGSTSSQLPAKKRKESRNMAKTPIPEVSCLLPAKKRVWALPPDLTESPPPKQNEEEAGGPVSEDDDGIVCGVCGSTDGDPSDPIVLCDGCDLMVHASCYGNPLIEGVPEGDWFCARCLSDSVDSRCRLCPAAGGAIKPTIDGGWAHLVCALYVPEVFFQDPVGRDGIDCSHLSIAAYKDSTCYLCTSSKGCAIPCSELDCPLAFHVTCGLSQGLCIEYTQRKTVAIVHGFCHDHTHLWNKQQQTGKYKIVARD